MSASSAGLLQNAMSTVKFPVVKYCLEVCTFAKWELVPVSLAPSPHVTT